MTVTALLVCHDGARWLPAVLDGLHEQTRPPDRLVAVDTGSADGTRDLLVDRLGPDRVVDGARSSFAVAVHDGLAALDPSGPDEWVWLLHDDGRPAPDALERLVRAAEAAPDVSVLGPKVREWPSLRRLLEVGVTTTGTAARETGLDRGEYDQGQHDSVRDVLAVNTAGMLVRRDVLVDLGFEPRLPVFGADLDFGWRAARAGHRTQVVPEAVVFHVEAARRGLRPNGLVRHPRREERAAALFTNLANCSAAALPFQLVRLFLGSLLRALGLLLVRAPGEAWDETFAVLGTYAHPLRLLGARRRRRRASRVPARSVRPLLAPAWLPYRHGVDAVGEVGVAVVRQVTESPRSGDAGGGRRRRAAETGPVPDEAESLPADTGLLSRLLVSPVFAVFAVLVVLAVVAARSVIGAGYLSGGALLPAPESAMTWWRIYLEDWHADGVGSAAPAGAYLLPLAVVATVLLGKAWLAVDLVLLLAVPLCAWGAHRLLRRLVPGRWAALWGAITFGLVPVLTGAVGQGRLGTVAGLVLVPWVAAAATRLASSAAPDRRWRAGWRILLLLTLLTMFVPVAWPMALAVAVVALVGGVAVGAGRRRDVAGWGPLAVAVLPVPVLLAPSAVPALSGGAGRPWWSEAGLEALDLVGGVGAVELLLARPAAVGGAPGWLSVGLLVAAVGSLLRRDTRAVVTRAWVVLLVATAAAAILVQVPTWAGFPLAVAHGAAVVAVAGAGAGISTVLTGRSFGWRQPVGVIAVVAAVFTPLLGLFWWVGTGVSAPLERTAAVDLPAYMAEAAEATPSTGVLEIRSRAIGPDRTLEYTLVRGDGRRLGDEALQEAPQDEAELTRVVGDLATTVRAQDVTRLGRHGVGFVYAPAPADDVLVGNLDSVSGLAPASATRPGARAWQLEGEPSTAALPDPVDTARPWWLLVQGVGLLLVLVLAAPSRERVR